MVRRANHRHATAGALAAATLVASALAARHGRVSAREAAVFLRFNRTTDAIFIPAWAVMQVGSLGAVGAAAAATAARRGQRPAAVVLGVGTSVWAGVKLVKPLVGRGRPNTYLTDVNVRGLGQSGLGYPSGHAAVATTLAIITTRGGRCRIAALATAGAVGCARMYTGAHLPLDVIGGVAIGSLAALIAGERVPG